MDSQLFEKIIFLCLQGGNAFILSPSGPAADPSFNSGRSNTGGASADVSATSVGNGYGAPLISENNIVEIIEQALASE